MNKKNMITVFGIISLIAAGSLADMMAKFDFENHTAGDLLAGIKRSNTTATLGDGFAFNNNASAANVSVSTLAEIGPATLDRLGANVRRDTLAAGYAPGGNFLEISPARLTNHAFADVLNPNDATVDSLRFSVAVDAGYQMSLASFSFDIGVALGAASNPGAIAFRGQGWYSVDNGTTWAAMRTVFSQSTSTVSSFSGFTYINADLSGIAALQNVTDDVLIALSISDDQPPFPRPPVRLNGSFRCIPQKANS